MAKQEFPEKDKHVPIWKHVVGGSFTTADELCVDVRRLQCRAKLSNAAVSEILNLVGKYLNIKETNIHASDRKLKQSAGAHVLRLNGCVDCKKHVYHPDDEDTHCPFVKPDGSVCGHPRFDEKGKPFEVFIACLKLYFSNLF